MNRCKTCKWWESVNKVRHWYSEDMCMGGWCKCGKLVEESPHEIDSLVYSYNEGGSFWAGPEFGCVHHAERPAPHVSPAPEDGK